MKGQGMSIESLHQAGLPLNRKERFYTGTVLPFIVFQHGEAGLSLLLDLLQCPHPPLELHPALSNVQFMTEYGLKEPLFKESDKKRFALHPASKDAPDVVVYIEGSQDDSVLAVIEANVRQHQPGGSAQPDGPTEGTGDRSGP
ncbi:MAG: hypothetical protein QOE83_1988 [Actinomycetota bacterium]|jgi:hypothetical protein|nr:hypothetical protein [Actinomycetota bacterium]